MQKYLDYCDKQILSAILKQLYKYNEKAIYEISINKYGTRALQKLFEKIANYIKEEDVEIIIASIKGNITSMIKNINGNHVIQSIIENIKNKDIMAFLYKEINQNLIEILKTKPGFCVFEKILIFLSHIVYIEYQMKNIFYYLKFPYYYSQHNQ